MNEEEKKEWQNSIGINICIDECVEKLRNEFGLNKKQIAKELREKAMEVNPPKLVSYQLPDGTEISKEEYLKLKKIFGRKVENQLKKKEK